MVANRRTVLAGLAILSIAVACVGPALSGSVAVAGPTSYAVQNYSFESPVVSPGGFGTYSPGGPIPSYPVWCPTAADFPPGGGSLPGTAAGSQCAVNTATSSGNDIVVVAETNATLAANTRYTMTVAVGSPLTATIMDGQSFVFADANSGAPIAEHDDMYPTAAAAANHQAFKGYGSFGDISYSIAANDYIGKNGVAGGDPLVLNLNPGAGVCFDNVRLISQNWFPMYSSGTNSWESSVWSNTSGSGYSNAWVAGKDAVFEGTGGTVTLSSTVTANSLNFANDSTGTGYTIQGSGTITLTGNAVITTGAGTNNSANAGGGINTISCVLAGSAGMYKAGGGTLILTATNTYTGGTTIGGGTLQLGNGGTSGSIVTMLNNVTNLANLAFNHSGTFTYGGVISGTGSLTQMGPGRVILTGANSYTGNTTVQYGYLEINNATALNSIINSTTGAGANITGGELVLDYTGSSPIATVLTDLASGKITDSAITVHSGPGAMALGWKDTGSEIDILPTLIGDTDLNGTVDNNDLGQLLKYFNKAGGWTSGDFNGNGTVDNSDLGALLANFNHAPLTLPLVVSGANPVPEPSTLIMLASLLALVGAWGIGRRRNRTS